MDTKGKNAVMVMVIDLLSRGALAGKEVSEAQKAIGDQREGAYSLYVKAAIKAETAEILAEASDKLFADIRRTGTVNGKSLGCKKGSEGGFIVPNAISTAKSILQSAMAYKVPLVDEKKKQRSFGAIRKDVFALNAKAKAEKESAAEAERLQSLTGMDRLKEVECKRVLAELADIMGREDSPADLRDLIARVDIAMRDYGLEEGQTSPEPTPATDEVTELMDAADMAAKAEADKAADGFAEGHTGGKVRKAPPVPRKARAARKAA